MPRHYYVKELNQSWAHPLLYKGKYRVNDPNLIHVLLFDFNNTPIVPYLGAVVSFFCKEPLLHLDFTVPQMARDSLFSHVTRCLALSKCLRDFKVSKSKASALKGLTEEDRDAIYSLAEQHCFKVMDYFDLSDYEVLLKPDNSIGKQDEQVALFEKWKVMFEDLPCSYSFEFEDVERDDDGEAVEDGEKHLSLDELNYLVERWEYYEKLVRSLTIATDKPITTRFLEHMVAAGIPDSRKIYKELYRLLDSLDLLPDHVDNYHKKTGAKYSDSGYIRSLVHTILGKKKKSS